jgi:glutathione synthase/RimK-type ligase-like ATP-grasp enzyme
VKATAATAEFLRETRSRFSNLSLTALAVMELPTAVVVQSVPVQVCAFPRQAARVLAVSRGDPDGSSAQRGSRGVHKVESMAELERVADELCEETDLLLAQKFLPTELDWRVGVLAGEPPNQQAASPFPDMCYVWP